jgi:hypothetical protein
LDDTARKQFFEQVKRTLAEIDAEEENLLQHCVETILKVAMSCDAGPLTLLLPGDDAFRRVGVDPESDVPIAHKDKIVGLMLDQILMSALPPPAIDGIAPCELMTLAGAPIGYANADGVAVLTDGFGREAKIGPPLIETPKITCRPADNILMWDEWSWL